MAVAAGLLHSLIFMLFYSRLLNCDFKTQSEFKGSFIIKTCSRNMCDLLMSWPDVNHLITTIYIYCILCIMIKIGILWRIQPADHLNL